MAHIVQLSAFSVSCYLTMGMFSSLVDGVLKVWIFRGFGFIYEFSKLSILKKSFDIKSHRLALRFIALILMSVSVSGAVLSAVKDTMVAEADSLVAISVSQDNIDDLVRQRDIWIEKSKSLPADYKTSAMAYAKEVERLQGEISAARAGSEGQRVEVAKRSGVFEATSEIIFGGAIEPSLIRFLFFVIFILLNEVILFVETYLVSMEGEPERWKIFHLSEKKDPAVEEEPGEIEKIVRSAVNQRVDKIEAQVAGRVNTLF